MTIISSNPSPKENGYAVTICTVGNIKAGTTVMIEKITGETAVVIPANSYENGIIPLAWLVALPDT